MKPKVIVVLGPTATGKSDVAVQIAKKFNGEIISADSRQVFRSMDLGSGKITKKETVKIVLPPSPGPERPRRLSRGWPATLEQILKTRTSTNAARG